MFGGPVGNAGVFERVRRDKPVAAAACPLVTLGIPVCGTGCPVVPPLAEARASDCEKAGPAWPISAMEGVVASVARILAEVSRRSNRLAAGSLRATW